MNSTTNNMNSEKTLDDLDIVLYDNGFGNYVKFPRFSKN